MPAEFITVHELVVLTRYTEPILSSDFIHMMSQLKQYADQAAQPIIAIADLSGVKHFPATTLTMAHSRGLINPVRNPKVEQLLVITDSAYIVNIVSVIGRLTGADKMVLVRTQAEAAPIVDDFISKYGAADRHL